MLEKLGVSVNDFDRIAEATYWELPSGASPAVARTGLPDTGLERRLREPATIAEARVADRHGEVLVPSLNIASWYDAFQQGTIDNYIAAREQRTHCALDCRGAGRSVSPTTSTLIPTADSAKNCFVAGTTDCSLVATVSGGGL
ncbi:hypothetical protein OIE68_01620 [Nocardia vinacea]|uniref:hypothetical protein n=1 Tax=Nocardia vinacea TaxID=96468 RepID=UPI002E14C668|nr:hypothetical protein OIE68_01620 [Nocardia vinacea]